MSSLSKNWRIYFLVILLFLSVLTIGINGLKFGIDFNGGTLYQIHLGQEVKTPEEMERIVSTITQRLDWTGMKDTKVTSWGNEFIVAQLAETDPETVERIEALIKKQGKFEVTLGAELVFTGDDIIQIPRDPAKGYGFNQQGELIQWALPFTLKSTAGRKFTEAAFHKCSIVSYDPQAGTEYDCDATYFFIDRPVESILVFTTDQYLWDRELFIEGNIEENIPGEVKVDDVLLNADLPYERIDSNISSEALATLQLLAEENKFAIISPDLDQSIRDRLAGLGFTLKEVETQQDVPWIWTATGARQIISLSEDVANMDKANVAQADIMSQLVVRGFASDLKVAQARLNDLTILLESGSLSVPVESISKETISPLLGQNFLASAALIGIISLLIVAAVLYIRYRVIKLTIPIIGIGLSEVVLILGFASLINWNLDLAAIAGILAVVGTGVDDQIIITDELIRGEGAAESSLLRRIKSAFFIIFAAAATTIATMLPIIVLGFGLGRLVGFAIATIVGVLIGVFITRPTFAEIAKKIISK